MRLKYKTTMYSKIVKVEFVESSNRFFKLTTSERLTLVSSKIRQSLVFSAFGFGFVSSSKARVPHFSNATYYKNPTHKMQPSSEAYKKFT